MQISAQSLRTVSSQIHWSASTPPHFCLCIQNMTEVLKLFEKWEENLRKKTKRKLFHLHTPGQVGMTVRQSPSWCCLMFDDPTSHFWLLVCISSVKCMHTVHTPVLLFVKDLVGESGCKATGGIEGGFHWQLFVDVPSAWDTAGTEEDDSTQQQPHLQMAIFILSLLLLWYVAAVAPKVEQVFH